MHLGIQSVCTKTIYISSSSKACVNCYRLGLPSIIQSDNGRKFVNKLIEEIVARWPGQVLLVNGRPCHPQSQGLVKQAVPVHT